MTLREAALLLESGGVPDARFDATELICHTEKVSRAAALVGDFYSDELMSALSRRAKGEPLQYILGEWDFYGYTFKVTPECLIPRFDTELLCSYLIENLPQGGRFADLCTGTGCIAIAALKKRQDAVGVAVELYPQTAAVALENAERLGVSDRLRIITADATSAGILDGRFDVIVSNPPYVTAEEMRSLQREVAFEPARALTDGGDGLSVIREIVRLYPKQLNPGGTLAIEIGARQGNALRQIAEAAGLSCTILRDNADRDRIAVLRG